MNPSSKNAYARLLVLKCVVEHAYATPPKRVPQELVGKCPEEELRKLDDEGFAEAQSIISKMRQLGLWKYASPNEKGFLLTIASKMDEYAHMAAGWRVEGIGMLMWAFGLIEEWPKIDVETSADCLDNLPLQRVGFLSKHPNLRPGSEIAEKRNLIEFWHWRARTRQLIEEGRTLEPDEKMRKAGLNSYDDIVRMSAQAGHDNGALPEIIEGDFVFLGKPFRSLPQEEYYQACSIIMERHYALNWLCGMAPGNRWDETPTDT